MISTYLDWAATAPPDPDALDYARQVALEYVGNPSSLHFYGKQAAELLAAVPPGDPTDPPVRAALIAVVRAAPWSDPAWTAAERLGDHRQDFLNPSQSP